MKDVKLRYLEDPTFNMVVDSLRSIIHSARLAPSEVREAAMLAAMLACIIEEEFSPRHPLSTSDEEMDIMRSRLKET